MNPLCDVLLSPRAIELYFNILVTVMACYGYKLINMLFPGPVVCAAQLQVRALLLDMLLSLGCKHCLFVMPVTGQRR